MANEYDLTDGPARVLLGTDTKTHAPVYLSYVDRPLGVAVIGKAGTGKSSLLEHMILSDLEHGTPGMVIDPHGLLAQRVMECATPEQADRIILLEASQTAPFGLNLLAVREAINENDDPVTWAADSVVATIKKLYGESDEFLPRLERYLDLAARTLIPSRRTLLDAPRLFEDDTFRRECLARIRNSQDRERLQRKWAAYGNLRPVDQITHTEALVNRLERLFASAVIAGIIGSRETTVPFDEILSGDKMLIVSLPSDMLSQERCDFIGAMLLCALADRIFVRNVSVAKPPRLHLYLDEYQRFATVTTAELLEQGRKYNAGVTLAHQTLYQIPDQRIRNAARHAGTLIALSMTRPDAEELAGEFPITPQEEWIETIEEVDGTEPVHVLSPTPAEDIYLEGHNVPEVDIAARTILLPPAYVSDLDKRKSAGVQPRPGGMEVDGRVKVSVTDVQSFLSRAMAGELFTNELFADALIEARPFGPDSYHPRAVFFFLANRSPSMKHITIHQLECPSTKDTGSTYCNCTHYMDGADKAHNEKVLRIYEACARDQLERIRAWILSYLDDRDALKAGENTEVLKKANASLASDSKAHCWDGLWNWVDPLTKTSGGEFTPTMQSSLSFKVLSNGRFQLHDDSGYEAVAIMRERLRWLVVMAEGLERSPLWVTSGEQQPRRTKRHIVHGGQTHADALNEFAGRLVHPKKRYVAHVRQPQAYHKVKLRPPLDCGMGDGTSVSTQPDDIRTRSRARYQTHPDEEPPVQPPSLSPKQRRAPEITRHSQDDQ